MTDSIRRLRAGAAVLAALAGTLPAAGYAQNVRSAAPPFVGVMWIDVEDLPELSRRAQPAQGWNDWLSPSDFDAQAFAGREIDLRIRLRVSPEGIVLRCGPRSDSDMAPYLTRAWLAQRGHVLHALSTEGEPVEGDVDLTVELSHRASSPQLIGPPPSRSNPILIPSVNGETWTSATLLDHRMPHLQVSNLPNPNPRFELDVTAAGVAAHCTVSVSTGRDDADLALCKSLSEAHFAPARHNGKPVPQHRFTMGFRIYE